MTQAGWPRVKELFHAALEREQAGRAAFLAASCGSDLRLRDEVERLLAAHAEAGSFIEDSPVPRLGRTVPAVVAPLTGRVLDRYDLSHLIGVGATSEVYAARDTALGRTVALKVMTGRSRDAQLGLRREAQHASKLNHPHICTIHDVGTADGRAYIVMEHVEGRPLGEWVAGVGLPVVTVLRYGIQIADALVHAHSHGVIHRDLKSANIAITQDGRTKILDFGLSQVMSPERARGITQSTAALSAESGVAGTLPYMAPELLRGEPPDTRGDLWALGVVLYEMAAGRRPFTGRTMFELSAAILNTQPEPLPVRVPDALRTIIERCLAKDPRERYGQASDIRSALEAVPAEVGSRARQDAPTPAATRVRARRGLTIAIVGLIAAVVATFAIRWGQTGSGVPPVALGASGRAAIALMPFDNVAATQETAWLSKGVSDMLLTGLAQSPSLDIVTPQRLQQAGAGPLESVDPRHLVQVARQAGAGAIVVGSIIKAGPEIRIDARLEDLATGRILFAGSVQGQDLFAMVDQLAARIRDGIGAPDTAGIRSVTEVSTASLEAYRYYSEGRDARANGRYEDAQRLLDRAVAVDSDFAEAYIELAALAGPLGHVVARREYLRKAAARAHRLSERQRLLLQVHLARDDGNFAEAGRILDHLIATFPAVDDAYLVGFRLYLPVNGPLENPQRLLQITGAGVKALPGSARSRNLYGYALLSAGRYAEALREFEAYARLAPREASPFDSVGDAYLAMGLPERAIDSYSRAFSIDPGFQSGGRAWTLAVLGRFDEAITVAPSMAHLKGVILARTGRYREAAGTIATATRRAESAGDMATAGALRLVSSLLAIERRDGGAALREIGTARELVAKLPPELQRSPLMIADLLTGLAQLERGNVTAALAASESQQRALPATRAETWWHRALEAETAFARGDLEQASTAFAAARPDPRIFDVSIMGSVLLNDLPCRDVAARVAAARGDLGVAIDSYRRLLSFGPEQHWIAAFEPRYVLEIARLLDRAGHHDAARQEYDRFLDLWKHADSDLPELAEARRAARVVTPERAHR